MDKKKDCNQCRVSVNYNEIHGLESDSKCVEDAIRASIVLIDAKKPSVFDWKRYIKDYPDLQHVFWKGGQVNVGDATHHYLKYGIHEKRRAYILGTNEPYVYDFDWEIYDKLNPDVYTQREQNLGKWYCFRHWCEYGHKEERPTGHKRLMVKNDASISTDEDVNNKWRTKLTELIQPEYNTVDDLINSYYRSIKSVCKNHAICKNITNIIVCSHSNLSYTAGDTIMLSNWINHFMDNNIHVTLLTKYSISDLFVGNLRSKSYTLLQCKDNNELIIKMNELQYKNDRIFIRNHEILNELRTSSFIHKICFYGLDIHLEGISLMQNKFHSIITQSEQLKSLYVEKGVLCDKIDVIEPLVEKYDFELHERTDNGIRLIYCGTLRDEENILEIIEEFQKIHKERPEVLLKIVYGKIVGNKEFVDKVNRHIKNGVDGCQFKYNLSHKDACYEIATSDIGICWRKNGWGENGEVSTKVKEYEMYWLDIITNLKTDIIFDKKISLICCTKRVGYHYNILQSIQNINFKNKYKIKLLVCLNNTILNINMYKKFFDNNNIDNKIIESDKSIGECLNLLIKESEYNTIIKIDDDDIYLPGLIEKSIRYLNNFNVISTNIKYVYCPENNSFYVRENNIGFGSVLIFNKNKIKLFTHKTKGEDTDFLKLNKVKLVDLSDYHIYIRHIDNNLHCDNDEKYFSNMKKINFIDEKIVEIEKYGLYEMEYTNSINKNKINNEINNIIKYNVLAFDNINKLNIIGIFDEFLFNTYKNTFNITLINPGDIISDKYSFFFCESSWNGNNGKWAFKINSNNLKPEINNILNQCKKSNIPTIFYNKEDPINFESYIETAKHFDFIITTDINSVNRYKKYTNSQIFVQPFTIDPFIINNIGRQNDNDLAFFAGTYGYNLPEYRKINTNTLLDTLKKKDFIIFDRSFNYNQIKKFYNNKFSLNIYHPKYNKYIHESIEHDILFKVHKSRNWCGNLNTINDSDTMFARRIIESSIIKNSVVSDYSKGVYNNFKDSIYKLNEPLKYNTNMDILINQIKKQKGWRNVIQNYNTYTHLSNLFDKINILNFQNPFNKNEKISIICSTNRINNYSLILDNFNRQKYKNKELIIIFNLDINNKIKNIIENNNNSNIKIKQIDEKETLGYCLNQAMMLSSGSIISKFDDDDYYGEYYLIDMYYSMLISHADLVGKCAHMVYTLETKELWIKFYNINYENYTYQAKKWNFICGGSLFFKKNIIDKCRFKDSNSGEDTLFLEQVKNNGFTIYASDFFNYCCIRDIPSNHTYKTDLQTYLGTKSLLIDKFEKIPIELVSL